MDISIVRLLGILLGAVVLVTLFARLRGGVSRRANVWLRLVVGVSLVLVGLFPGLATVPSQLLSLGDVPGGRITTLLLLSTLATWLLVLQERSSRGRTHEQFDLLVRRLAQRGLESQCAEDEKCDVAVIIPAYNEADNIGALVPRMPAEVEGKTVRTVVVDDGSSDATAEVARRKGALVSSLPVNRGGGAALRMGYDAAHLLHASVIVTMDGDGQHSPDEIARLVAPILADEADIVIGSRVLGSADKASRFRSLGVVVFSGFISLLMGVRITDSSSGFRAFRIEVVDRLRLQQDQYHTAELIIDAAKRGFRLEERPVHIHQRMSGKSKKGKDILYAFRFLRTVLTTWWR